MYLSRLAAEKEYAFMRALKEEGFLVPDPLSQSRHTILMSLVDAFPLRQIASVPGPAALYAELIALILRLAKHGLIHGDFNEFNILIKEEPIHPISDSSDPDSSIPPSSSKKGKEPETTPQEEDRQIKITPVLIDFPQMVSMDHVNAEMYFDRDVACVKRFFERRFHFVSTQPGPFFKDAKKTVGKDGARRLDAAVEASGFSKKALKDLEAAIREQQDARGPDGEHDLSSVDDEDDEEDDDEDEDEDGDDNDRSSNEGNGVGDYQKQSEKNGRREDPTRVGMSKLTIGDDT
ncbi:hypothetical protein NPX13_g6533 [Xylaria arbuscula]|uniref:non-specific serine/threonine protein kinase n=1 Tax=Xylaria arbuscula TaxID=114810 RepID=A0A9W8NBN9_9PEZI|nr:hypothetical protein NPX13_g6533 [Xylaria arbuscula]